MDILSELNRPGFWLYFVYTLLVITAVLHIVYQRRSPQNLMAWLLTLLLLPFIGLLLYITLGSRKFFTKRKKPIIAMQPSFKEPPSTQLGISINNILKANNLPGATKNNSIQTYQTPTTAFNALMQQIASATSSIHLQTYLFELDNTGKTILDA